MKHSFLYIFLFFLSGVGLLNAQPITVKAKMDSTQMWIGNQTALRFEVVQSPKQKVNFPLFSDTIVGALEIVQQQKLDTVKLSADKIQVNAHYVVTSFHDSLIYVPEYPFVSGNDTAWSNSTSIKVIQPFKIDTTSNVIADIKPVFKPKFNWAEFFKKFLLVSLVIALVVLLFFLVRRFKGKKPIFVTEKSKSIIPAHVEALEKLDKIKNEKIWQQGRIKEYHTELTDVIRNYIERAFNINSMEITSEEILQKMQFLKADKPAAYDGLKQILQLADLVKFAKWNPATTENELSLLNAYLFVNQTKVEEIKPLDEIKEEILDTKEDNKVEK
ncbi:conserved exported hypothetical protein [uncultured Paludibacter sp.]|uniref:Protein BatD n=1 Tax=uncultured Paludibacter sp. TaxID=497635 RepID=A0A653ABL3_9BACT|nr:conserved exported hypothetical protein [uncultured Paludibacter sp.]